MDLSATRPQLLTGLALQLGDAALVRVALHAPLDGPLVLGSVLAGTFDFRASQIASSSSTSKCIQASRSSAKLVGPPQIM